SVSIQGMHEIQKDETILHEESLVVVGVIARAGNDLASSHESFMTYVLDYGEPGSSIFYNNMVNFQSLFMQFLRDYKNQYSLAVSPNLGNIITSQGQMALITEETRAYGVVVTEWENYSDETTITISLLRAADTASAYNSAKNASLHMQIINMNMEDLINVNNDAAALTDAMVHKATNKAILYTLVGAAAVAVAIILLSFVFSSSMMKPIVTVSKTAKTIADGNFRTRLEIRASSDEVGDLVRSMNMLIDNTSKPLIELTESAQAIAGGDMTRDINVVAKGDLATLVEAFKQMRQNLSKLTNEIKIASESLKDSSASFAETIGHMTENTQQVSSAAAQESKSAQAESMRIDEMVRMLSEQTKAIYDVVQSSQNAAGASANASEVAQNGSKSAQISLEKMNSMLRNVEDTAEAMKLLSKKSKEISQVVSIITDIAHQTNLLSLNAAIEAARAGEQGRGFAVVADEVRKLAEGSRKAANQIQQLIELVESDIDDTTDKMEHTMKDASESSRTISDSLKSLEDIAATVQETAAMVQEISASTEEQKALTESLAKSLDEVAAISKENSASSEGISVSSENLAAGMEELTASAHELADLANQLNEITKQVESAKATVMTIQEKSEGK
ncbi:MAG: methyl-accepting chemotaxis protein, partial [Candidatus Thermoplasmatota archaeon]|nr:methyl-accepting chemotaxis protein [Candidatus Thermoplasmatota archaeon]